MSDRLIELFAEEFSLASSVIDENSSPETVEAWDSLASMRLVEAIEDSFGVKLTTGEIMKMNKVGIVREVLRSRNIEI